MLSMCLTVSFEFTIKGFAIQSQNPGGKSPVATKVLQNMKNVPALNLFQENKLGRVVAAKKDVVVLMGNDPFR